MLADEAAGFGAELEDGEGGGVVEVEGLAVDVFDAAVELCPLVVGEVAVADFLTFDFADVGDETVHELNFRHFKREEGEGDGLLDGDVAGHGEGEGGFSHRGACGEDDEVGVLPSGGHLVEVGVE